jgi:hypothetical protein
VRPEPPSSAYVQEHLVTTPIIYPAGDGRLDNMHGNSVSQPDLNLYMQSEQGSRFVMDPPVKNVQSVAATDQAYTGRPKSELLEHQHAQLPHTYVYSPVKSQSSNNVLQPAHLSRPSSRQPGYATQMLFPQNQNSKVVGQLPGSVKTSVASSAGGDSSGAIPTGSSSGFISQQFSNKNNGQATFQSAVTGPLLQSVSAEPAGGSASQTLSSGHASQPPSLSVVSGNQASQQVSSKPVISEFYQQVGDVRPDLPASHPAQDKPTRYPASQQVDELVLTAPSHVLPAVHTSQKMSSHSSHKPVEPLPQYPTSTHKPMYVEEDHENEFPPPPSELLMERLKPDVANKGKPDNSVMSGQNFDNAAFSKGKTESVQYFPTGAGESQDQVPVKKPPPVAAKPKLHVRSSVPSGNNDEFDSSVTSSNEEQKQMQRLQEIRRLESRPYLTANEQAKLHRLRIEAEFDRRLKEANDEQNEDNIDTTVSTVNYSRCARQQFRTISIYAHCSAI